MEIPVENIRGNIELNSHNGSLSLGFGGVDSNALLLPAKIGKKRKCMNQVHERINSNKKHELSKTQERKLKKLEKEKEGELLLKRSIETLNKYKIPEYAYPLLHSAQSMNQIETVLERRSRAVHLLKEGLEFMHNHDLYRIMDVQHRIEHEEEEILLSQEVEENNQIQLVGFEREHACEPLAPLGSSKESACGDKSFKNNGPLVASFGGVFVGEKIPTLLHDYITHCPDRAKHADVSIRNKSKNRTFEPSETDVNELSMLNGSSASTIPTIVHVCRPTEVQDKRKDLPIVMMEQEIMEAIRYHSCVIICGETGCGKTTQVPQFLYEAGYGSSKSKVHNGIIGVTQPRRISVLATSNRVAYELGLHLGEEVGFQVRYDKKIGDNCSIKFMTDGILLREIQNDFLLRRYSVIVLDEAHERSLNIDILIGMLSLVIESRKKEYIKQKKIMLSGGSIDPNDMIFPLKLVLMSATLRVEDFTSESLFLTPPPVIEVPTRQFPVTIHFSKKTQIVDYIGQAYKKVMAIHKRLPPGGILVFVTGQREVEHLCRKLRNASRNSILKASVDNHGTATFGTNFAEGVDMKVIDEAYEIHGSLATQQTHRFGAYDEDEQDANMDDSEFSYNSEIDSDLEFDVDDNLECFKNNDDLVNVLGDQGNLASLKAAFEALSGKAPSNFNTFREKKLLVNKEGALDQSKIYGEKRAREDSPGSLLVLPLYAMLPPANQLKVFEKIEGKRLVVVATNVAETSLTIPGIKYVVDTGREKVKNYNSYNGMATYEIQWISKASAAQRAGRAGRTGPGHCYRLYSSAVFNNILPDFSLSEVSKVPIHSVVLLLKSMLIEKVEGFPFPTPPSDAALVEAHNCLCALEALNSKNELTPLGKVMALYPLTPRHSKMLLTVIRLTRSEYQCGRPNLLLAYAAAAAAALSLFNPFVMHLGGNDGKGDSEMHEKSSMLGSVKVIDMEEKFRRKKLKENAKAAYKKFRVSSSDALTIAYALHCFEHSEKREEFCCDNALHYKTMQEMSKLRHQLLKLVLNTSIVHGFEQEYSWIHGTLEDVKRAWQVPCEKYPLLPDEEQLICEAICAGWVDRVAKRITRFSRTSDGSTRVPSVKYQAHMCEESVFLHRGSSVSMAATEFLVYNELLHTKRPYMHGVTCVEPAWLVKHARYSCKFSEPQMDPRPFYDSHTDQVKCWVNPTFGLWELPKCQFPVIDNDLRRQVFAYALLDGQVCPCLKSARKYMAAPPESILKKEAFCQKRVVNLLSKLKGRSVDSSAMLRMVWEENPMELYTEILDWFQQRFHNNFNGLWLQMLGEVLKCL